MLGPKCLEAKQLLQLYSYKWWGLIQTFRGTFPQRSLPALQHRTWAFPQAMQGQKSWREKGRREKLLSATSTLSTSMTASNLKPTHQYRCVGESEGFFFSSPTPKNYFFLTCASWMYEQPFSVRHCMGALYYIQYKLYKNNYWPARWDAWWRTCLLLFFFRHKYTINKEH